MLNRRAFVQSLGAGPRAVSRCSDTQLRGEAATRQERAARPAMPADAIRIGSNENPYGPTAAAIDAAQLAIAEGHRYGGSASATLVDGRGRRRTACRRRGCCCRADRATCCAPPIQAFTSKTRALVVRIAQLRAAGAPGEAGGRAGRTRCRSRADLKLDLAAMLAKAQGAGLVYICNPNNPTSTIVPVKDVTALIDSVVADVADHLRPGRRGLLRVRRRPGVRDGDPAASTKYPQLIVARTFSKIHGMAGMRVGYAVAQENTLAVAARVPLGLRR